MKKKDVGRFMVAVGAVLECLDDKTILLVKRSITNDFRDGEWEIIYGRISQFEDAEHGLRREYQEETGISGFTIGKILRIWHIFRGKKPTASNELIGITYSAQIQKKPIVRISDEHAEYRWVSPKEALKLITNEGIKDDIRAYLEAKERHA